MNRKWMVCSRRQIKSKPVGGITKTARKGKDKSRVNLQAESPNRQKWKRKPLEKGARNEQREGEE